MSEEIDKIGHVKKAAFLAAYAATGTVLRAAEASEVSRASHYGWLKDDPEYAAAFKDAHEDAVEAMEVEARRRATQGWEEPVYYKGEVCGAVRKFSDTLLIFLLKGGKPEKYRDRVEHTGAGGGPMQHRVDAYVQALQEVRDDPHYAEVRRAAVLGHSGQSGLNGAHREPGQVANGQASRNGRSGHH